MDAGQNDEEMLGALRTKHELVAQLTSALDDALARRREAAIKLRLRGWSKYRLAAELQLSQTAVGNMVDNDPGVVCAAGEAQLAARKAKVEGKAAARKEKAEAQEAARKEKAEAQLAAQEAARAARKAVQEAQEATRAERLAARKAVQEARETARAERLAARKAVQEARETALGSRRSGSQETPTDA